MMTFVDRIRWRCRLHPQEPALVLSAPSTEVITYARLEHCLNNACRNLSELGIVHGTVYGLLVKDTLLHLVLSLALEELGAGTMVLHDLNIPNAWKFTAILSERPVAESNWPVVPVDGNWLRGDGKPLVSREVRGRSPDDICRVIPTSGSTGIPKGVVFTHRTWEQRVALLGYLYGELSFFKRVMSCLVGAEYRLCIFTLSRGGMYCTADPTIESTGRKISLHKIQYLAAAATTLGNIVAAPQVSRKGFESLELIRTSGSHLPRMLAEKVRDTMCSRLMTDYGTAETGTVAAGWAESLDLDNGEVGSLTPGTEVDLVDAEMRAGANNRVGTLRIRSAALASGYFGGDETKAFNEGAFYSHDLGSIASDGRLTIFGRSSNVINLGGDKATIERIELNYSKAPGIQDLAVVPVRDALGLTKVVAIIVPNEQWSEQIFWEHFRNNIPRTFWPAKVVVTQGLPRLSSGKIDRAKLESLIPSNPP